MNLQSGHGTRRCVSYPTTQLKRAGAETLGKEGYCVAITQLTVPKLVHAPGVPPGYGKGLWCYSPQPIPAGTCVRLKLDAVGRRIDDR